MPGRFVGRKRTDSNSKEDPLIPPQQQQHEEAAAIPPPPESASSAAMAPRSRMDVDGKAALPREDEEQLVAAEESAAMYDALNLPSSPEDDDPPQDSDAYAQQDKPLWAYWQSGQGVELVLCLAFYVGTTIYTGMQPFAINERPIPFQFLDNSGDYVLNQEYNQEKMGSTVSPTVVCMAALVLQLGLSVFRRCLGQVSLYEVHATVCTYTVALSLNRLTTEWIKHYVGYLRPIFYQKCVPDEDYQYCTDNDDGGRKSFPSGHASISFTGCMMLLLYLHYRCGGMGHYKARMERRRYMALAAASAEHGTAAWQHDTSYGVAARAKLVSLVALLPVALATAIAADRVRSNHHFPADVVGGAVLGSAIASFVHSLWF